MASRLVLSAGLLIQASPQILNPFTAQVYVATELSLPLSTLWDLENFGCLLTGGTRQEESLE